MSEPRCFLLPVNQCLLHARQKLMDSAYIRTRQPDRVADADFVIGEARQSLQMAVDQGWPGDIERTIADFLASPSCDFSA